MFKIFQVELPYLARAKALRHELAESGSVDEKLAAKDKELQDSRKALKLKVCCASKLELL